MDITIDILTDNYLELYGNSFISRNDQVDVRFKSSGMKVTNEPLDMLVLIIEAGIVNVICIIREQTIVRLLSRSVEFISPLLTLLNGLLSTNYYITLDNSAVDEFNILINFGFVSPTTVGNGISMYKAITPSPEFTRLELRRVIAYMNEPSVRLKVRILKETLENLSGYVNSYDNEVGGPLHIFAYDEDVAIVKFDTSELIVGESDTVMIPFNTMSFHTHPDLCYRTLGCYIGWPSAQDMIYLLMSYFTLPTLLHLVSTAEGIWAMQLTSTFQRILSYLHAADRDICIQTIADMIQDKFTKLHAMRQLNIIPPLQRHQIKRDYESLVKIITLSDLFSLYPDLEHVCSNFIIEDGPLYNISLTTWDTILSYSSDLDIIVDYNHNLYPTTLPITFGKTAYNRIKNSSERQDLEIDLEEL